MTDANATRNDVSVPTATQKTTPKLSDIKQYYALGFCGSITGSITWGWLVSVQLRPEPQMGKLND